MNKNTLLLLNVVTTPTTVVTESQMLGVLELSGIVRNPDAVRALTFAASLSSSSSPATLLGFLAAIKNLAKLHPDYTPADAKALDAYAKQVATETTDVPLTFGLLLAVLNSLPATSATQAKTGAGHPEKAHA
jgi:hypothetical protein